ncbi:MAG: mannose-1-phosphate guanylyltransferase [Smithellaceae bacterium]|nr:mannose-1-phosphate guanylyltransferase [Smithellaceae bacterium]
MYAVIMAGGKGTRFWPRSRERMPKHLLDIISEKTILQETVERIKPLIPEGKIFVVTGASHVAELKRQLPELPGENIIIEPVGRNTAPCIGLAALHIRHRDPKAVMVVLPSDHLIIDEKRFRVILKAAARTARDGEHLVTVGIEPTAPETGYGYLEMGAQAATVAGEEVFQVKAIREKPNTKLARSYIKKGTFLWNSGMFIWKAETILAAIERHLPDLHAGLAKIERALGTAREQAVVKKVYGELKGISIDYGVMEKAKNVLILKGAFGWSDVGSWDALWEVEKKDASGLVHKGPGPFIDIGAKNSLVSSRKLTVLVGVEDLIVVETKDALMICKRGASQRVREVVEALTERNLNRYL